MTEQDRPCEPEGCRDLPVGEEFFNIGHYLKGGLPYQPWAAALVKQRMADNAKDDPDPFCDAWDKDIVAPLKAAGRPIPRLVTLKSPYRYILYPIVDYVLSVENECETRKICVLVPELVVRHWWDGLLHNRRSDLLKVMLLVRGNRRIIVINIPWYMGND